MQFFFRFLAAITGIYSILIFLRIILSWFSGLAYGKPAEFLIKITDPYLDFWKNICKFRIGFLDFSVIAALLSLSLLQGIFNMISVYQRIYLGYILGAVINSLWSLISFIVLFCIIIIIIRGIAYLSKRNMYSTFWSMIDSVYQPLSYRINRIIFKNRIVNFKTGMAVSLVILSIIFIGGRIAFSLLAGFLYRLPI